MVIDVFAKAYAYRKDPKGEEPLIRREKLHVTNVDRLSMRASALKHIHNPSNKSHESLQSITYCVQHCVSAVPETEG
jgi:hypothetical protein